MTLESSWPVIYDPDQARMRPIANVLPDLADYTHQDDTETAPDLRN